MTHPTTSNRDSLTGVWSGFFSYPGAFEPGQFTATLLDFGGVLSGTTHEPDAFGDSDEGVLYAEISGRRNGAAVEFAKTYDGSGDWDHTVRYEGELSPDGLEIEGTWSIPGAWSGTFLMIRGQREDTAERALMAAEEISGR